MSVELVRAGLAAAAADLERARAAAAAADSAAEQIAAHAADSGFAGIADRMAGVRASIREIRGGIEVVVNQAGEAAAATAAMSGQATPQEAIASLMVLLRKIEDVHGGLGAVIQAVDKATHLAEAALRGGRPGPLRARLDIVRQALLDVVARLNETKRRAGEALAQTRALGDAGNCVRVTGSRQTDPRRPRPRKVFRPGLRNSVGCFPNGAGRRTRPRATW